MTFEPELGQVAFSNSEWFGDEAEGMAEWFHKNGVRIV